MNDQSSLDALGPILIIGFVGIVTAVALWLALDYNADWGSTVPPSAGTVAGDGH